MKTFSLPLLIGFFLKLNAIRTFLMQCGVVELVCVWIVNQFFSFFFSLLFCFLFAMHKLNLFFILSFFASFFRLRAQKDEKKWISSMFDSINCIHYQKQWHLGMVLEWSARVHTCKWLMRNEAQSMTNKIWQRHRKTRKVGSNFSDLIFSEVMQNVEIFFSFFYCYSCYSWVIIRKINFLRLLNCNCFNDLLQIIQYAYRNVTEIFIETIETLKCESVD